jgi:hypothetical protein
MHSNKAARQRWYTDIDRRSLVWGNFERGEIVSPVGCIASKVGRKRTACAYFFLKFAVRIASNVAF